MRDFTSTIHFMKNLHVLSLGDNQIGDSGIKYLSNKLPLMKNLSALTLRQNQIGNQGIKSLSDKLPLIDLKALSLSGNEFGIESLKDLSNALRQMSGLAHLILDNHPIGDQGIFHLSAAL